MEKTPPVGTEIVVPKVMTWAPLAEGTAEIRADHEAEQDGVLELS